MKKNKKSEQIVERYSPSINAGLSNEQVEERKLNNLVNNTKQKTSKSYARIFIDNIFTYFNVLWLAIFVALLIVGSYENLFFIIVIVLNTSIAIFQEIRSKKTVEKLSLISSPKTTVVRDGEEKEILADEIVLDDIIVLELGNQIPADCIILDGEVEVNESLLTGESRPVKKEVNSELLAGSFLISGKCYAKVMKVGNDNYIQTLAKAAKKFKQPNSNLFKDLNKIIKWIGIFIIPIGAIVFCNNYLWAASAWGKASSVGNIVESVSRTCGSLIGMIPSGMFLLVSIALTVGVIRLSEKKTLVQDIYSIEMLARSNVLCLDKTGTITDGTMTVKDFKVYGKITKEEIDNAISSLLAAQPTQNSTSRALSNHFGIEKVFVSNFNIPFSSDRKYTATSFEKKGTYVIGAFDYIKPNASREVLSDIKNASIDGNRVLVVAYSKNEMTSATLPENLEVVALVLIEDTIRKDAVETIQWFKDNGVAIKIISGDDPQTVSNIAKRVGVENYDKFINLEGVSIEDVKKLANDYTVFGRVSPEQKHAIIKALKEKNVVAMTGDGVNDTLALKEADCSIAMADGSEVARNISHLVLLNSNFSSLPSVVEEGRRVINNVQNSSTLFFMKTVLAIVLSLLCVAIQVQYPFYPKNMFLLELFVIGIPSFLLALQQNKKQIKGGFVSYVLKHGIPFGLLMCLGVVVSVLLWKFNFLTAKENETLATLIITITGLINLVAICRPLTRNKCLIILLSFVCLVAASLIMPWFFGITAITENVWKLALIVALFAALIQIIYANIKLNLNRKRKNN